MTEQKASLISVKGIRELHACSGIAEPPIHDAAMVIDDGRIAWLGAERDLPEEYGANAVIDAEHQLVLPGLIDCHTHLAFAGSRADEFERRLMGESYLEIAKSGGGIKSTVAATRACGDELLLELTHRRLEAMIELGVTTVECKSGYGLDKTHELRQLRIYRELERLGRARIVSTFLGAHVVAPEFQNDRSGYLDLVVEEMLPAVAEEGLAQFCDVFVEEGAFTFDEAKRILRRAAEFGLGAKLHVDQLSDVRGGRLALETEATSADHLEHTSANGIAALAEAGTVAVTLPFATLFLRQQPAPARQLIDAGVPVAVATDFNPGSAPSHHLPLAMLMACVSQSMTASEVLMGATLHAARAIEMDATIGSLEAGKRADFVFLDAPSIQDWIYHFGRHRVTRSYRDGRELYRGQTLDEVRNG